MLLYLYCSLILLFLQESTFLKKTMKYKLIFCFLSFCLALPVLAQNTSEDILFTIENEPVYASEFIRVYNKNLDLVKDETQKDIDGYLKLFINYKLKLKEAKALGLDKKTSYLREFESYKKQLSKNYLNDSKVTDALIKEAYGRLAYEVKASHILIRVDENASPKDTLAAYNEILKLRNRVINEGYEAVQKEVHNGKTIFAEDLGYFSAFKMVYDFENAAYNTEVGEVSMPFRTRFGFHVVKVFDKRASRGEVEVGHIMIKEDDSKINEIYKRLEQGENFESLAKQFSEDKSSSSNGGRLKPFSGGELSSQEFEDAAFGLEGENAISKPFKSQFGWHIIKLYGKKTLEPFKEMEPDLRVKIKRDSRSQLISASRLNNLKERYNLSEEKSALPYFASILNDDFLRGRWSLPSDFEAEKPLLKIQDKQLTYKDFGEYLLKSQRRSAGNKIFKTIVEDNYKQFFENEVLKYEEDNLELDNEEYAQIVGEYRDGLLLFDLMENEIWNTAKKDSVALQNFYDAHKADYFFNERVEALVASSAKKGNIKKVAKLLQKGDTIESIKTSVNTNDKVNVTFTTGELDKDHQALPKDFKFKEGVSNIYKHNDAYVVVKVNSILPKTPKTFEESKGKVISDYQVFKEDNWLKELAFKYVVNVNQEVLNKVKSKINNQ